MKHVKQKSKRMSKEEVEKKKKTIIRIFIAIIAIVIICIAGYIANDYIILGKNKTTNLVINNTNVTGNLKQDVFIDGDNIYLSKQDLSNFFDKYIYEDEENNKIITTYEDKIATIGFDENEIEINGSTVSTYAHAIEKDDSIFIPITELKDVYGIEIEYIANTDIVTIDSVSREQKKAIANGNLAVKSSTNFIAKTVDRVKKGDYVIVISDDGKNAKIRTANGKIGYVKSKKLANTVVTRQEIEEQKPIEGKVNLVWDYYSQVANAPDRSGTTIDGINVVSPAFYHLNTEGELEENIGEEYNLDGINIDFENMKKEDIDLFSRFIIELEPRLKEIGAVLSVDVTAPDGSDTWSLCFDRTVLGDVADYLIFMAYDQYGVSSTKPGTTAGYNWVELSLNKFLTTEEIEPEKIILAVPLYTRVWTTNSNGELVSNPTIAMKNIDSAIPDGVEKQWDDELKQNYVKYAVGDNTRQIWIEDIDSLKAKVSLITENNLGEVLVSLYVKAIVLPSNV